MSEVKHEAWQPGVIQIKVSNQEYSDIPRIDHYQNLTTNRITAEEVTTKAIWKIMQ